MEDRTILEFMKRKAKKMADSTGCGRTLFNVFACANFLIISFIILLDNILRIILLSEHQKGLQYTQALLLVFFDKELLATIVFQAFITYFGVVKTKFYFRYEKRIFFSGTIINLILSIAIASIFIAISEKLEHYGIYYYCEGRYA